jgi:hypothetical protein
VTLLGGNTDAAKETTKTFSDASEEVGLEVNVDKSKSMLVSRDQNADQNWDIAMAPWPLVRKRTIPTERPSLVGEI